MSINRFQKTTTQLSYTWSSGIYPESFPEQEDYNSDYTYPYRLVQAYAVRPVILDRGIYKVTGVPTSYINYEVDGSQDALSVSIYTGETKYFTATSLNAKLGMLVPTKWKEVFGSGGAIGNKTASISYVNGVLFLPVMLFSNPTWFQYIYYTTDGTNWTNVNPYNGTDNILNGQIGYVNGRYLLPMQIGHVAWSTNLINWTTAAAATPGSGAGIGILASNSNNTIVMGAPLTVGGGTMYAWISTNGTSWGTSTIAGVSGSSYFYNLKYVNNRWFGSFGSRKISISTDSINWNTQTISNTLINDQDTIMDFTYYKNTYVMCSYLGRFLYSTDAITWSAGTNRTSFQVSITTTETDYRLYSVTYGDNRFIACGESDTVPTNHQGKGKVWVSTDAVNWYDYCGVLVYPSSNSGIVSSLELPSNDVISKNLKSEWIVQESQNWGNAPNNSLFRYPWAQNSSSSTIYLHGSKKYKGFIANNYAVAGVIIEKQNSSFTGYLE